MNAHSLILILYMELQWRLFPLRFHPYPQDHIVDSLLRVTPHWPHMKCQCWVRDPRVRVALPWAWTLVVVVPVISQAKRVSLWVSLQTNHSTNFRTFGYIVIFLLYKQFNLNIWRHFNVKLKKMFKSLIKFNSQRLYIFSTLYLSTKFYFSFC